jgi:hypothetical protein
MLADGAQPGAWNTGVSCPVNTELWQKWRIRHIAFI